MAATVCWPRKRLGELAEFRNGVNYNKSSFGRGVKVVGVKDFQDYTKPKYSELEQINPKGVVTERNILHDGDIVFVRSNGNRELIGRSLFIEKPPEEVTHSAFTIRLRFTSQDVYPKFYAYCFRTPLIRMGLTAYGGGTNISNLNQDILGGLEVPLPDFLSNAELRASCRPTTTWSRTTSGASRSWKRWPDPSTANGSSTSASPATTKSKWFPPPSARSLKAGR